MILGIILIGGFAAFSGYKKLNETAMKACILSLESPIVNSLRSNNSELNIPFSSEWKTLDQQESKALISRLVMTGLTDCRTIKSMQEGEDYWGNPINIMISQSPVDGKVVAKIWSNGADGKEDTEDDMLVERGF